jgi:hypothetical protein
MKCYHDLDGVKHALNVALLPITNNRILSFIFIVLALILGMLGVLQFWEMVCRAFL